MSFEEYDALEIAKELQANSELGRSDFSEPRAEDEPSGGMTRRDLLVRGGVGAAAVGGRGRARRRCRGCDVSPVEERCSSPAR